MPDLPSLTSMAKSAGCAAKIAQADLSKALAYLPKADDPNLIVDHTGSDDAAVYRLSDDLALVKTVDVFPPIVDDPFYFGQIAATNALSEIYAMGAKPISALSFVGWPVEVLGVSQLGEVLRGAAHVCSQAGITIAGGHSIVDNEPKFGLFVTSLVHPKNIISNSGALPGDLLVLTKKIGTDILTTAVKHKKLPKNGLNKALASMPNLNAGAAQAMVKQKIKAATDVTGFGLLCHLGNMRRASSVNRHQILGAHLSFSKIPFFEGAEALLEEGLCPMGTLRNLENAAPLTAFDASLSDKKQLLLEDAQTSGGLLISAPQNRLKKLLNEMEINKVGPCAVIGQVTKSERPASIYVGP